MCYVMFVSALGLLSDDSVIKLPYYTRDGEEYSDYRSAPGKEGEPTSAGLWGGEFPSS